MRNNDWNHLTLKYVNLWTFNVNPKNTMINTQSKCMSPNQFEKWCVSLFLFKRHVHNFHKHCLRGCTFSCVIYHSSLGIDWKTDISQNAETLWIFHYIVKLWFLFFNRMKWTKDTLTKYKWTGSLYLTNYQVIIVVQDCW